MLLCLLFVLLVRNDTAINRNSNKCCVVHDVSEEFSLLCTILDGMLNGGGQVVDKKS